jgi:hypothetical protein
MYQHLFSPFPSMNIANVDCQPNRPTGAVCGAVHLLAQGESKLR